MDLWEKKLACALNCRRCDTTFKPTDQRILSVYDHEPICLACKREEEQRPDYKSAAHQTIGSCMADSELFYGDPNGFCYHHFYPFSCE